MGTKAVYYLDTGNSYNPWSSYVLHVEPTVALFQGLGNDWIDFRLKANMLWQVTLLIDQKRLDEGRNSCCSLTMPDVGFYSTKVESLVIATSRNWGKDFGN